MALDVGDAVRGAQARRADVHELDPALAQLRDGRLDVGHVETHLRVVTRRPTLRLVQDERRATALVAQPALAGLGRLQAQLVGVEAPGAAQVLSRQADGTGGITRSAAPRPSERAWRARRCAQ